MPHKICCIESLVDSKPKQLPAALLCQRGFMIMAVILSFFGSLGSLGMGFILTHIICAIFYDSY